MASLLVKIRNAASAYAPLTTLLGTTPFRVYDQQLAQGSAFPATNLKMVSGPQVYTFAGRLATNTPRMQHTIFGALGTPSETSGENARAVIAAWISFYDQFNADGITGRVLSPNQCLSPVEMGLPETAPFTYIIVMDVMIFNNSMV